MKDGDKLRQIWEATGKENQGIIAEKVGIRSKNPRERFNRILKGNVEIHPKELDRLLFYWGINIAEYNKANTPEHLDELIAKRSSMASKIKDLDELQELITSFVGNAALSDAQKKLLLNMLKTGIDAAKQIEPAK